MRDAKPLVDCANMCWVMQKRTGSATPPLAPAPALGQTVADCWWSYCVVGLSLKLHRTFGKLDRASANLG